jgi:hypothetical protein
MAQRCQVAARAHAALLGHHRDYPGVEHRQERVHQLRADAAGRSQKHVGPKQHEGPDDRAWQRSAYPGRMTADQVDLKLVELVGGDADVGELSEAGVDAVDRLAGGYGGLDQPPALHQGFARRSVHADADSRLSCGADDVPDG